MAFIWRRVREVGGIRNAFYLLWRTRDVRAGTLVGEDKWGNTYYENNQYFFGRHRWVLYSRKDFDATQVPPEWHRWLHSMTDHTPIVEPPEQHKFVVDHTVNTSGTSDEYIPYSTTRPKIHSWQPNN
jgi:NADH:ubiquinone oxidoreductase subunit